MATTYTVTVQGDGKGCLVVLDGNEANESGKALRKHVLAGDTIIWSAPANSLGFLILFQDSIAVGATAIVGTQPAAGQPFGARATVAAASASTLRFKYTIVLVTPNGKIHVEDPQIIVDPTLIHERRKRGRNK